VIRELFKDIYQIEVVLPQNPLRALNAYIIKGKDRNLLIDTGFRKKESLESLTRSLEELKVDMDNTDIFVTHLHDDHIGLVPFLINDNNKVYIHPKEKQALRRLRSIEGFNHVVKFNESMGFPKGKVGEALGSLRDSDESMKNNREIIYTDIVEGDILEVGDYKLKCILTPGHTLAHCCLYEENQKILLGGDLILAKITPNIAYNNEDWLDNPLDEYLKSLDRISKLNVDITLSSHRALVKDTNGRIRELKEHTYDRLEELLNVLDHSDIMSPYDVASRMKWSIRARNWEEFPLTQKFFALGECMANIIYLEKKGFVERSVMAGKLYFKLSSKGMTILTNNA